MSGGETEQVPVRSSRAPYYHLLQTAILTVLIAFFIRTFLYQPFTIPSGSMQPALMKGDYIITSKYSLGYGPYAAAPIKLPFIKRRFFARAPKRGDITVFHLDDTNSLYIKRLIGLPGDVIALQGGQVYINGLAAPHVFVGMADWLDDHGEVVRSKLMKERLPDGDINWIFDDIENSPRDNMSAVTVPEGYFFFLGDNRDHSSDSRMRPDEDGIGLIPSANLIGRAEFILFSPEPDFVFYKPGSWSKLRRDRFFKGLR